MAIGERIKYTRKRKGLTQAQLAEKLGLSTITIRQYESNKREPRHQVLKDIARALDVDFSELVISNFTYTDSEGKEHSNIKSWDEMDKIVQEDIEKIQKKAIEKVRKKNIDESLIDSLCALNDEEVEYVRIFVEGLKERRAKKGEDGG